MAELQRTGLELVMQNYDKFMKEAVSAEKQSKQMQSGFSKLSDKSKGLQNSLSTLGFGQVAQRIGQARGAMSAFTSGAGGALAALAPLALAVGALTVSIGGFIKLASRGSNYSGIINAFNIITQSSGILASKLRDDLSAAAAGTVADMDLLRLSNAALAGVSGETGKVIGEALPRLMEVARAQSIATGNSVEFLFDSLVNGVKKAQPQLIDNTYLQIKVGAANEAMAKSVGKTVDQLSAEEKQIAILNATLEAGKFAVDNYLNGQETASIKIDRLKTTITNTLDGISLTLQPAFETMLDFAQVILDGVLYPIKTFVIPIFAEFAKVGRKAQGDFKNLGDVVKTNLAPIGRIIGDIVPYVALLARGIAELVRLGIQGFTWLVKQVASFRQNFLDLLFGKGRGAFSVDRFAFGGARMVGALATGMLKAANEYVFPTVLLIAKGIADFLVGFSPPKKGPLSKIDQGGANVMEAWLKGFTGVGLKGVAEMAAEVQGLMGNIATFSREQVEKRLGGLDRALQPFIDRAEIAQARFEAMTAPLERMQKLLSKKLNKEVNKLFADGAGAEQVRALDRQAELLRDTLDMRQDELDMILLQKDLMSSRQAEERALLAIRLRQLGPLEKEKLLKAEKDKKAKGGKGETPPEAGGAGGFGDFVGDPISLFGGGLDTDAALQNLLDGFNAGFDPAQLETAQGFLGEIGAQGERIKSSKPFSFLQDTFGTIFGDGPESLTGKFEVFKTGFDALFQNTFGEGSTLHTIWTATFGAGGFLALGFNAVFGAGGFFRTGLTFAFAGLNVWRDQTLGLWAEIFGEGDGLGKLNMGAEAAFLVLKDKWEGMFNPLTGALSTLLTLFDTQFLSVFFGTEGTLASAFSTAKGIAQAKILYPITGVLNALMDAFAAGVSGALNSLVSGVAGLATVVPGVSNIIENITTFDASAFHLRVPPGRLGGMFQGMVQTHKDELIFNAGKNGRTGVFPQDLSRDIKNIVSAAKSTLDVSRGGLGMGGSSINNNNQVQNNTYQNVANEQHLRVRWAQIKTFGGL